MYLLCGSYTHCLSLSAPVKESEEEEESCGMKECDGELLMIVIVDSGCARTEVRHSTVVLRRWMMCVRVSNWAAAVC